MDILKDIEKNLLNIDIYNKNADNAKLNIIKKQISEYFNSKNEENNIIMEKKMKYEDKFKRPRELNNANYEQFLEKKMYLKNIYKETKSLSALNDYLNCKLENYANIPEIYTYEYLNITEQKKRVATQPEKDKKVVPNEPKVKPKVKPDEPKVKPKECPEGQILNPTTNRCVDKKGAIGKKLVKNLVDDKPKVKPQEPKVKPQEPKVKPQEPKVKPKECPEGQILNPVTNRCVDKKGAIGKKLLKNIK